jgi:hypothetical protein
MATSGTYNFNPSLGEVTLYAYQLIGLRPTSLLQEHFNAAQTATNMMFTRWSNQGVNLWQVQFITRTLTQGQQTYPVNSNVVVMLDSYITTGTAPNAIDRVIMPVSRTEYMSYPNKNQQGFPTVFWFDRQLSPTFTLWPVPDGSQTSITYAAVVRIEDANLTASQQMDIPPIWLEAMVYGLAYRLAQIWAPDKVMMMKPMADEAYEIAAAQNIETANQYISPQISGYFR